MNNKFEELKKQCGGEKIWDVSTSKWVDSQIDLDKYAELIVIEATKAVESEVNNWQQLAPFNNIIKQRGVYAIKRHFGL